ncbi:MAG: UvrB/UvrC motif-containing protein [Patescibacteria group bacterium]|nr:UvrB/UvrC motif-containing protein [Patescibacteria group bacterium]
MFWANFLHIYQPPDQKKEILKKVVKESYQKLIQGLKENPKAKLTLNINACLTELLINHGFKDLVFDIKSLAERGQIELTASAKYHAFLPLLPENEIKRQIKLNQITNQKYFGKIYSPKGFFPPEMAFSNKVAKIAKSFGFDWILADEASFLGEPDYSKIYKIKGMGDFKIFFREREASFKILSAQLASGPMLIAHLGERLKKDNYLLTAMDGETFGHHRPGLEKLLFDIYKSGELTTVTISELENYFKKEVICQPVPATWALMHKDLARNTPFSRWYDPKNKIHQLQWRLTNLAIKAVNSSNKKGRGWRKARMMLDKALHSDQYWWASAKPWWSLEILEKGAKELKDVVLAISGVSSIVKRQAQELYQKIVFLALDWQREGVVEDLVKEHYDEEVAMRLDTSAPYVPPEEFDKIIEHLRKQMLECARIEEFERAAQFRDRIKELKEKREEATKKV